LLNVVCKAQVDTNTTTGKKVMDRIHQLQAKKIDTIVCYYVTTTWMISVKDDSCTAYETKYLLWTENNKNFIQKFTNCKSFQPITIDSRFFNLIRNNYLRIKKEEIKNPEYTYILKGKPQTIIQDASDIGYNVFEIYTAKEILRKSFADYYLNEKYLSGKHLNKNYDYNQKTTLNKLSKIIERQIKSIN